MPENQPALPCALEEEGQCTPLVPVAKEEANLASPSVSSKQPKQRPQHKREIQPLLVVDQEASTETPAQEENAAAPQFIEQESQTKALAPGAAVKPFCMWSLRRGLGRAVYWERHWPREWPPGNTYISQELWHI